MKKYFTSQDARAFISTYGFSIFPVHGINEDGKCTCGDSACTNPGKHPATSHGLKDATNNIDDLLKLWAARKFLNVGIATGQVSNIFVIDIDSAEGEKNLKALGDVPTTLSVTTGKGRHLYFLCPGEAVVTKKGILPGVDVRGDGGYVCGPGSNHISGNTYEWINPLEEIQIAPDFILDLVVKSRIKESAKPQLSIVSNSPRGLNIDGWSLEDVYEHLKYISPDLGYDEWIVVGMALQNEGHAYGIWDAWSAGGSKYKGAGDTGQHWKSFKKGNGVTYGTIVHLAKQGGWKPKTGATYPVLQASIPRSQEQPEFDENTGEITEKQPEKTIGKHRRLPLIYANDVSPITNTSDFIENLLCENQFSVIYGESNCGKTFFMMDLSLHVALGRPWRGREVDQGGVIYAALEGGYNTQNRIVAFKRHHEIAVDIPMAIIPSSLNLLDPKGDIHSLVEAIWEAKERIGNIKLVVIDTLSRALHGGDENSSMDMGQLIINADAIRAVTGAHISFIHHSGKDAVKGARGHSSLRAAVDTEIEISRLDERSPSKIKVVKQREMEMGEDMFFTLSQVELGTNQRNKPVTSCVVIPAEGGADNKFIPLNPIQTFIYDSLIDALLSSGEKRIMFKDGHPVWSVSYDQLREVMESRGFKEIMATEKKTSSEQIKSATQSARLALKKHGKINFNKNYIWAENYEKDQ